LRKKRKENNEKAAANGDQIRYGIRGSFLEPFKIKPAGRVNSNEGPRPYQRHEPYHNNYQDFRPPARYQDYGYNRDTYRNQSRRGAPSYRGSKYDVSNYRPLSLTSILCKVMERIIKDKLLDYFIINKLICKEQHGFVPRKCYTTNLLEELDIITLALSEGKIIDVIYTDYSKAFDKVNHKKLIHKLEKYGIKGAVLNWIKDFLSNGLQRVVLGDSCSDWASVTSDVPQGSVLGPLLFVIYINELPNEILSKCRLYADDNKIFRTLDNSLSEKELQFDLDRIFLWSDI
ncbi:unnamed protein product, partial [Brachionus calyciflorus]